MSKQGRCPTCDLVYTLHPHHLFYYSDEEEPLAQCNRCARLPVTRGGTKYYPKRDQIHPGINKGINALNNQYRRDSARRKAKRDADKGGESPKGTST